MAAQKPILTYWKGRGRGEAIRLALAAAEIEWTDGPFIQTAEDMQKLKDDGKLLYGQLPLLEWEGKNMVMVGTIIRHIARKYGMDGKTEDEKYQVDLLTEGAGDFLQFFLIYGFKPEDEIIRDIREKGLPRYMPVFEKVLSKRSSGFLVGDSITTADTRLFEVVSQIPERCPDAFNGYPKVKVFYEKISNLPQMKMYLTGPQRFGPNDKTYVDAVKRTLGW